MNELRAPRLTENRLADLDVAVVDLQDSIEYLEDATKPDKPMNEGLRKKLAEKAAALTRAKNWIEGKVAAERGRRDQPAEPEVVGDDGEVSPMMEAHLVMKAAGF